MTTSSLSIKRYPYTFFCLAILLFQACTTKTNIAHLRKDIDGQQYVLMAESGRNVNWMGIGGSCMVLPVLFPSSTYSFRIQMTADQSDTLTLEYSDHPGLLDEEELSDLLKKMQVSIAPGRKQIWFSHPSIARDEKPINRIVHRLNDSSIFYSNEHLADAPSWQRIASPSIYYEKLLADTAIDRQCSVTVWDIESKKPTDDQKLILAFSQWSLKRGAYYYLGQKAGTENNNPVWKSESDHLAHRVCDPLLAKDSLTEADRDDLTDLVNQSRYFVDENFRYDPQIIKAVVPVCEQFFFREETCAAIINDLANNDVQLSGLLTRLLQKVELQPDHTKQLQQALILEQNALLTNSKLDHPFLPIYLREYPTDAIAYNHLADNLQSGTFTTTERKNIEALFSKRVNKQTDSLSNELLSILKKNEN